MNLDQLKARVELRKKNEARLPNRKKSLDERINEGTAGWPKDYAKDQAADFEKRFMHEQPHNHRQPQKHLDRK